VQSQYDHLQADNKINQLQAKGKTYVAASARAADGKRLLQLSKSSSGSILPFLES